MTITEINQLLEHEMNTGGSSRLESTRVFDLQRRRGVSLSGHFTSCQVESQWVFVSQLSSSSLSFCEWSSDGGLAPSSCPSPHRPGDFLPHATFNGALRQFKKQLWIFNEQRKDLMWVCFPKEIHTVTFSYLKTMIYDTVRSIRDIHHIRPTCAGWEMVHLDPHTGHNWKNSF